MSTQKYSLWLNVPLSSHFYETITSVIQSLCDKYDTPLFDPHVTLVGGINGESDEQIVSKFTHLIPTLSPIKITILPKIVYEQQYFRSLCLLIEKSDQLIDAFLKYDQHFNLNYEIEKFTPHMSLIYSDLDVQSKLDIISNLQKKWCDSLLFENNDDDNRKLPFFMVNSLALYNTTGKVSDWYKVADLSLL